MHTTETNQSRKVANHVKLQSFRIKVHCGDSGESPMLYRAPNALPSF